MQLNISFFLSLILLAAPAKAQDMHHGLAMHDAPALAENFTHYAYANPAAPQGGKLIIPQIGSFDTLNPFSIRGNVAQDIRGLIFESLMSRHMDEPFALYGLIAQSVYTPPERSFVRFRLNPAARFSDNMPVTSEDVLFSWQLLRDAGRPNHRHYYGKVARAETNGAYEITFYFDPEQADRELPLIIGLMPVLPKHIYESRDIQNTTPHIPIGSGPYRISHFDMGRQIMFHKNPDYWGKDLAVNQGRYNIETLVHDYYRDLNSAFEAFKAGAAHIWYEHAPDRWQTNYTFPAMQNGDIIRKEIIRKTPSGLNALVMNTRRPLFAQKDVREAFGLLFDFEWINKQFFHGAYKRTQGYFGNTQLSAQSYVPPESDGSGNDRVLQKRALQLLKRHGVYSKQGKLYNATNQPITVEILVQKRDNERIALSYAYMLRRLGIVADIRFIDASHYQRRLQNFDFDMIFYNYYASLSPGNEQNFYWGSAAAETPGSRNYPGIKNKEIDKAIQSLISAYSYADFTSAARKIESELMAGHYVIPLYHNPTQWLAHAYQLHMPSHIALYGTSPDLWWIDAE